MQRPIIHRDLRILGGKPVIRGTRISVEFILELLASGMDPAEIASEYHLSRIDVNAALAFAASELKREERISLTNP